MMIKLITILLLLIASPTLATVRYVDPASVTPGSGYTSWATAAHDISTGIAAMSGGDELVIRDGTYQGTANMMDSIPSGNYGADTTDRTADDVYTIIRAENDFGVLIDGEDTEGRVPIHVQSNYFKITGIIFARSGGNGQNQDGPAVFVTGSNNFVFKNCGAYDGAPVVYGSEDSAVWSIESSSSYGLFEDCFGYGSGHYIFVLYGTDHMVFRRCVGRKDRVLHGVSSIFANYSATYTSYQNCIALDYDSPRNWHVQGDNLWGGFDVHGAGSASVEYLGCIAIGIMGPNGTTIKSYLGATVTPTANPAYFINSPSGSVTITNSAAINSITGILAFGPITVDNFTVAGMTTDATATQNDGEGIKLEGSSPPIVTDTILYDCAVAGTHGVDQTSSDYNLYYGNTANYAGDDEQRTHDIVATNPATNGLLYPVRIETSSTLKTAGSGGGQVGAEIVKRYGTDGTLHGVSGYNTLTANNLWPFPNEAAIRTNMRAYNRVDEYDSITPNTAIDGARGFCEDGQTLTKYIWESLGNTIPDSIYGITTAMIKSSGTAQSIKATGTPLTIKQ